MNLINKAKYIIYIDESNILSKTGHSVYVGIYIKYLDKDSMTEKINELERNLKISYLHWVDMPWKLRLKFAENVKNLNFICKLMIYKNPITQNNTLELFLLKMIKPRDNILKITVDGNKSSKYENKLKVLLKDKNIKFYKIRFMDDKKDPLIRLADFMAGFYRSFLDNKGKENIYIYNLLKHKIKIPD